MLSCCKCKGRTLRENLPSAEPVSRQTLEADGIEVEDGKVDLKKYGI